MLPSSPLLQAYLQSLAPASRKQISYYLPMAARLLEVDYQTYQGWHELNALDLILIRDGLLEDGVSPYSINVTLGALTNVARIASNRGMLERKRLKALEAVPRVPVEHTAIRGRCLSEDELSALLAVCATDKGAALALGARDTAVISVLYACALRTTELAALKYSDHSLSPPALRISDQDPGPPQRQRVLLLGDRAADALAGWVALRGSWPGRLFVPIDHHGNIRDKLLSPRMIAWILRKRARQADLESVSAGDLRLTAARHLFEAGADLTTVGRILGHQDLESTAAYDPRTADDHRPTLTQWEGPYHKW